MNRGDIVHLWGTTIRYTLTSRDAEGYWRCVAPNGSYQYAKESSMTPTFTAHARRTDPTPAHQAAATVNATDDAHAVLLAHLAAGPTGLTGDELATALGRPYEAVGPRRPALRDAGWVEQVIGPDGKQVRRGGKGVWRITDAGVTAAHNIRRPA